MCVWCVTVRFLLARVCSTPMLKLPSRHAHLIKPPSKRGPLNIGATVTVPKTVRLTNVSNPSTWAERVRAW